MKETCNITSDPVLTYRRTCSVHRVMWDEGGDCPVAKVLHSGETEDQKINRLREEFRAACAAANNAAIERDRLGNLLDDALLRRNRV